MSELKEYDVVIGNKFLLGRYTLSASEKVIVYLVLREVNQSKMIDADREFRISAKDFAKERGIDIKDAYRQLIAATNTLYKRSLEYVRESKSGKSIYVNQRIIYKSSYEEGTGGVYITFAPEILEYLFELKSNYTTLQLSKVGNLSTGYAMRIYEILKVDKMKKKISTTRILVDDLLLDLEISNSYNYGTFKQRILTPTLNELKDKNLVEIDLIERTKIGRRVHELIFNCIWLG